MDDHTSKQGAEALAARIMEYWANLGYKVSAWATSYGPATETQRFSVYGVQSDMINGMPRHSD